MFLVFGWTTCYHLSSMTISQGMSLLGQINFLVLHWVEAQGHDWHERSVPIPGFFQLDSRTVFPFKKLTVTENASFYTSCFNIHPQKTRKPDFEKLHLGTRIHNCGNTLPKVSHFVSSITEKSKGVQWLHAHAAQGQKKFKWCKENQHAYVWYSAYSVIVCFSNVTLCSSNDP